MDYNAVKRAWQRHLGQARFGRGQKEGCSGLGQGMLRKPPRAGQRDLGHRGSGRGLWECYRNG